MTQISDIFRDILKLSSEAGTISSRLEAIDRLRGHIERGYVLDLEDLEEVMKVAERVYVEMPEPIDTTEDDKYDFWKDSLLAYA